ncbi:MAG: hypothetical protein MUO37_11425 [Methyloceanibacter sp.]|jgi:hypothetical protein|nr:hypothetical protein [Methyloceanibacter sp.]
MRTRISSVAALVVANLILGLTALGAVQALSATPALAADCSQGSADEKIVCLNQKVIDLEAKLAELTKDALKWNDRITLINEDMRIFPRCLENPGPNTPQLTDVYASSCTKTPAQSWMIRKPYQ